ncbi:Hypothetical protein SMAX5B_016622 [Scophthalmus maximus]|uniref:Uncharacterized protein n=1 Tax=Scophthalmus maximus TaxID=52904 RepID=A0A2U9B182_SCOMX|nr:Hypothetical protein SMAX5B_016622 [Scophthalmus maximus]
MGDDRMKRTFDLQESAEEEAAMEILDLLALQVRRVKRGIKATRDHGYAVYSNFL